VGRALAERVLGDVFECDSAGCVQDVARVVDPEGQLAPFRGKGRRLKILTDVNMSGADDG
jgi:hypothetical protein